MMVLFSTLNNKINYCLFLYHFCHQRTVHALAMKFLSPSLTILKHLGIYLRKWDHTFFSVQDGSQ